LIEVDRSGLVANYVGQTATKTAEVIESALDGILFIDEAYTLHRPSATNDYGREAVETILKAMEDYRDRLCVIFAGYPGEMADFMSMIPGLSARVSATVNFEDYSIDELAEIYELLATKGGYEMSDASRAGLRAAIASAAG